MAGALLSRASLIFFGILFFYLLSSTAQGLHIEWQGSIISSLVPHDPPEELEKMYEEFAKLDEMAAKMTAEERDKIRDEGIREVDERYEAQCKLFDYITHVRLMIRNRKNKLVAEERVKLCAAIDVAEEWFYKHLHAKIDKNEYVEKLKDAEDACNPIILASLENRSV